MLSNCYLFARWRYWRLMREWRRNGCPQHRVPGLLRRPTQLEPSWFPHWVAGWWLPHTCQLDEVQGFAPIDKSPLPWWRLWSAVLFKGHVKHGDTPSSH